MEREERFQQAVERINALAEAPPQAKQLELYGLYKQATAGDVRGSRPGRLDVRGRAKYDAWARRKGMSREEAMQAYIALADELAS